MIVPPEIVYRFVERTDELDEIILDQVERLERACRFLARCRIALERIDCRRDGGPCRVGRDVWKPRGDVREGRRPGGVGGETRPLCLTPSKRVPCRHAVSVSS